MATLTLYSSFNFSSSQDWEWDIDSATSTSIVLSNPFYKQTFTGKFTYDADDNVTGTVTATSFTWSTGKVYTVSGLSANAATMQGYAYSYGDTQQTYAYILQSADVINGSTGNDTILGYAGNDTLTGNAGNDSLDGGDGTDTAVFSGKYADATISYSATTTSFSITTSVSGTDTVVNVENFKFSDKTVTSSDLQSSGSSSSTDGSTTSTQTPKLVSANASGTAGDMSASWTTQVTELSTTGNVIEHLAISSNGRYIVFNDKSSNLLSGDATDKVDTFLKDMQTGEIKLIATDDTGALSQSIYAYTEDSVTKQAVFPRTLQTSSVSPKYANDFSISDDGRYVSFSIYTNDLVDVGYIGSEIVSGDVNTNQDVYVKDMQTGNVYLASSDSSGISEDYASGGEISGSLDISSDGRHVLLYSYLGLTTAGATWVPEIYLKDIQTGAVTLISSNADGTMADGVCFGASLSDDGRYVVFASEANNLVTIASKTSTDISHVFRKDLQTGAIELVSSDSSGTPALAGVFSGDNTGATISSDGRYVVFVSKDGSLVSGDTNNDCDVFYKDMQTGMLQRVSIGETGSQATAASTNPSMSDDGRYVVFTCESTDLVSLDHSHTGLYGSVYIKDMQTGKMKMVTDFADDVLSGGEWGVISGDGQYITFVGHYDPTFKTSDTQVYRVTNPFLATSSSSDGSSSGGSSNEGVNTITGDSRNNKISGSSGDDELIGLAGNDQLGGGSGDDRLIGGEGVDKLTGGAGADAFVFDNYSSSGASAADKIIDFNVSEGDTFTFDTSIFTALSGEITANNVVIGAKVKALDADDHLIFITKGGKLYYDADGNGSDIAVQIAGVKGSLSDIDYTSFTIDNA